MPSTCGSTRSIFGIRFFANPFLVLAVPFAQGVHVAAMYVPGLSDVLELQPIGLHEWATLAGISLLLLLVEELHKAWLRGHEPATPSRDSS